MQRRLLIDPVDAKPIQTLSGRWHYTEDRFGNVIKGHSQEVAPWSDLGDAFSYFLCGVMSEMAEQVKPQRKLSRDGL
jgi:hypothetical protein